MFLFTKSDNLNLGTWAGVTVLTIQATVKNNFMNFYFLMLSCQEAIREFLNNKVDLVWSRVPSSLPSFLSECLYSKSGDLLIFCKLTLWECHLFLTFSPSEGTWLQKWEFYIWPRLVVWCLLALLGVGAKLKNELVGALNGNKMSIAVVHYYG